MSSYYGDKSRDVPSWESFENADDDDIVDTSEVYFDSITTNDHISSLADLTMMAVRVRFSGSHLVLHRCVGDYADSLSGSVQS